MINTNNQPFTSKKIVTKQPETVYVLSHKYDDLSSGEVMEEVDVLAVYRKKIDAQNAAIKYGLHNYTITETELT